MNSSSIKFFLLSIFLFLAVSCSKPVSDSKILKLNLSTEPPTLDWNLASDFASFDVISNLMVGLTRFAQNDKGEIIVVPGCASSWQINANATEYLFKLNPQAKWSDGTRVLSQQFIDSFQRILDPNTAAPYAELLSIIDMEKTKAIDDMTLKIVLKRPAAYFIYLTAYGITLPIRKELIDKYGEVWTDPENLIVTGPFLLKKWHHEYKISLSRNPQFDWLLGLDQKYIQGIDFFMIAEQANAFSLFKNGKLDWIDNRSMPVSVIRTLNPNAPHAGRVDLLRNTYVGFDLNRKPFDNLKLRQALSLAIDRHALSVILSKGDKANSTWIPPALGQYLDYEYLLDSFQKQYGFRPTKEEYLNGYFPDLAKKLMAEAGYPDGQNFPVLELMIPNRDSTKLIAEAMQSMWAQNLNIKIKINVLEWKVYLSSLKDNPPNIFRMSWGADYPDPDSFTQLFYKNNQINYGKYDNPVYEQLSIEASSTLDLAMRRRLYSQAEALLTIHDCAIAPILIDSQNYLSQPNIQGITVNPMDIVFLDRVEKN
jgi:oligopeptide transport system substrate-binding protein